MNFWTRVEVTSGCWKWHGSLTNDGYGQWSVPMGHRKVKMMAAHRLAWILIRGPIADSTLTIDHLCRVRHCVNPWHMELVSRGENTLRGHAPPAINKNRTHCIRGHEFTVANTRYRPDGHRACRRCCVVRQRQRRIAQKEAKLQ